MGSTARRCAGNAMRAEPYALEPWEWLYCPVYECQKRFRTLAEVAEHAPECYEDVKRRNEKSGWTEP